MGVFLYLFSRKHVHNHNYLEEVLILMENVKQTNHFEQTATRVTTVSIIGNLVLSGFKLLAGILAHSGAMVSDAVHSASDVFSSIVVII